MLTQHRSTQWRKPQKADDEDALTFAIIELAGLYGRYGYKRITALLKAVGWDVNHKRVARIWKREGLKVPKKQPKRGRLWLNDGSCIRLRPQHRNHVWSYDFVQDKTRDGRKFRMLTVIDEFTRECLAIAVARRLNSQDVLDVLTDLMATRGVPEHIRSDNGGEFRAKAVQKLLGKVGVKTLYIEPGSPWEFEPNRVKRIQRIFQWAAARRVFAVLGSKRTNFAIVYGQLMLETAHYGGSIGYSVS